MNDASPTSLVRYDAMCRAIDAAHAVDEVKDIRDKAIALETYARLAKNFEAELRACEIRLRAERKAGQLLKQMEKAKGAPGNQYTGPLPPREGSKTLEDMGISYGQSSRWQKLADVPEDQFEAALVGPEMPTTNGIIAPSAKCDDRALWLWGRLKDFERDGLLDLDPNQLIETMSDHMKATTRRLAPLVAAWLGRIDHERRGRVGDRRAEGDRCSCGDPGNQPGLDRHRDDVGD